jgi:hypothetical protein
MFGRPQILIGLCVEVMRLLALSLIEPRILRLPSHSLKLCRLLPTELSLLDVNVFELE